MNTEKKEEMTKCRDKAQKGLNITEILPSNKIRN